MVIISSALRWCWVLGLALFCPVYMPVGGCQLKQPKIQVRRHNLEPFLTISRSHLRSSPFSNAPSISNLEAGTPVNILRYWKNKNGKQWLYVQVVSLEDIYSYKKVRRGWLHV